MRIGWQAAVQVKSQMAAPSLIFLIPCLPVKTTLDRSGGKGSQGKDDWLAGGRRAANVLGFLCHRWKVCIIMP
jgi:hypothetical protein